jgi:hypothetical protein
MDRILLYYPTILIIKLPVWQHLNSYVDLPGRFPCNLILQLYYGLVNT